MSEWQPIETAPADVIHTRAMWVYSATSGLPLRIEVNTGYIDDYGDFVSTDGTDFGWPALDYQWWTPLPMPMPEPPK